MAGDHSQITERNPMEMSWRCFTATIFCGNDKFANQVPIR